MGIVYCWQIVQDRDGYDYAWGSYATREEAEAALPAAQEVLRYRGIEDLYIHPVVLPDINGPAYSPLEPGEKFNYCLTQAYIKTEWMLCIDRWTKTVNADFYHYDRRNRSLARLATLHAYAMKRLERNFAKANPEMSQMGNPFARRRVNLYNPFEALANSIHN